MIALVSMPYASLARPSIALGILARVLRDGGLAAEVHYANLWFGERVGTEAYGLFSHLIPNEHMAGEWTFAEAAFREAAPDASLLMDLLRHHPIRGYPSFERLERMMREVRRQAADFVDDTARRVIATGAQVIGCTSTFEQHVASLALLRRIRELAPGIVTLLGGANCEAQMGRATHNSFPWVDFVVSGEADGLMVELCARLLAEGRDAVDLPRGVLGPTDRGGGTVPRATFRAMDEIPIPDFDDYFATLEASALAPAIRPGVPVELSRGCWWGAVHHCTFCGLNGSGMAFSSKSAARVQRELDVLQRRHGVKWFEAADNILDMKYFKTLLPALAEEGADRCIFYEVKANLSREQLGLMRRAGFSWIQPGIESLHSGVLKLMDKGVQAWQNIQLLRWAREVGMRVSWAILWGFPGEEDAWYDEMARRLPLLEHLQAPTSMVRLRYDRFSVYHSRPADFGLALRPVPAMRAVYPLDEPTLNALTYFFEDAQRPTLNELLAARPGATRVRGGVRQWHAAFHGPMRPVLSMDDRDGVLDVLDTRRCAVEPRFLMRGTLRETYLSCDGAPSRERVLATFPQSAVDELIARRLLLEVDGRLLALAVAGALPPLPAGREFPGGFVEPLPAPRMPAVLGGR